MKKIILWVMFLFSTRAFAEDVYDVRVVDYKTIPSDDVTRYRVSFEILKNQKPVCSPTFEGTEVCIRVGVYEAMTVLDDMSDENSITFHFGQFQVKTHVYSYLGLKALIADFGSDEFQNGTFSEVKETRARSVLTKAPAAEDLASERERIFDSHKSAGNW